MTKLLITLTLMYSMLVGMCPSVKTLEDAEKASGKLASYADTGINLTRGLYRDGILNLAQKDKIADAFIVLSKAGVAFDAAVQSAKVQYGDSVPKSEVERLAGVFTDEVVAKLLDVLKQLGAAGAMGAYGAVVASLRDAVILIAQAFGKKKEVAAQLAAAGA